jgi:DNA-binding ferritin-like protein
VNETPNTPNAEPDTARRQQLIGLVNQLLVDAIDLHMQPKQTRWQLTDSRLSYFHSYCDQVAEEFDEEIQELVNWASELVTASPGMVFEKNLPVSTPRYPEALRTQADHLKALEHSLKAFMKISLDSAVTAKNLGGRKAGNAFAHIARVPSRLFKDIRSKFDSTEWSAVREQNSLSIWVGEESADNLTGKRAPFTS